MIGLLLIPAEPHVRADLERMEIDRVVDLAQASSFEDVIARRTRGQSATVFASPARRWSVVMDAVRIAAVNVAGELKLRFYQPTVTISLRQFMDYTSWRICPLTDEFDPGAGFQASALRRAVCAGVRDLMHEEQREADEAFLERARSQGLLH